MKTKIFFATMFAMSIFWISCSEHDVQTNQPSSKVTQKSVGSDGVLFTFSTQQEFLDNAPTAINDLAESDNDYISKNPTVTLIVNVIKVQSGSVVVTETHHVDENSGLIRQSFILNPTTGVYNPPTNINLPYEGKPVYPILFGNCPQGSVYLGSCNSGEGFSDCMKGLAQVFALQNLQNGCDSMIQRNGLFTTAACATGCN